MNWFLRPAEALGQIVYEAFCEKGEISRDTAGAISYTPKSPFAKALDTIRQGYLGVKQYALVPFRLIDKAGKGLVTTVRYVTRPLAYLYDKYPVSTVLAGMFLFLYFVP